jgi:rhodanese-related sulfurtransferase
LAHTDVTAEQARDLIDSTNDLIVVDVREPSEYCDAKGHIPGALNYPWSSGVLQARYEELPIDGPILVVCRSGGRSNAAASFLDSNGFSMIYDMLRGMNAWTWETAPCKYSGGSGTADDPYRIATAADLIALGETPEDYDKHFILTADIDLDPNLPGGKVFDRAVIAPDTNDVPYPSGYNPFDGMLFKGVFDGNSHTISHLTIRGESYLGLFGQIDSVANIYDLGLEVADVNGTGNRIASLAGRNCGSISRCYSTGTVSGYDRVGGLVGTNVGNISTSYSAGSVIGGIVVGGLIGGSSGSITASHSTGTVRGDEDVGGLVGYNAGGEAGDGRITTSYSSSTVSGTNNWVGGLVGENSGVIATSYSTGDVSGGDMVGGLVGGNGIWCQMYTCRGTVLDCYSRGAVIGNGLIGGLVGRNLQSSITRCYSTGSVTKNVEDGWEVGGLVGSNQVFFVVAPTSFWDIEASGQASSADGTGKTTVEMQTASTFLEAGWDFADETANGTEDVWWIDEGKDYPRLWWEPLKYGGGTGEPNDPYLIYTAEHLNTIGTEPNDWEKHFRLMADIDLAGFLYDAALIAPDGDPCDPAFVGTSFMGVFDGNGHAISHLTILGGGYLGLFGRTESGAVVDNLGLIDANIAGTDYVGGLAGFNKGRITTSCVTGTISGNKRVGGLTGRNWGTIAVSYNAAAVTGNDDVGGLAAANYGSITNSYNTGPITANRDVGGLSGENYGSIASSYSTGAVSGDWRAGGLVGYNWPDTGIISGFWDTQTSGQVASDGGTGKTTAEMQTAATFLDTGWDFVDETANGKEDIWWILEGQDYPRLWWELIPEN